MKSWQATVGAGVFTIFQMACLASATLHQQRTAVTSTQRIVVDKATFKTIIAPILQRACLDCHGGSQLMSRTDFRTQSSLRASGSKGSITALGFAGRSRLHNLILGTQLPVMPPSGMLPKQDIAYLQAWILAGSPYFGETLGTPTKQVWWAFAPIKHSPTSPNSVQFGHSPIDTFVQKGLKKQGLTWNPIADRRTLIRRATFDVIGLAPTMDEVRAFENDKSPGAWRTVIDRLLGSERYGERWGRHWLDIVRYADSGGFEGDKDRTNAWKYRDWVISAFNQDIPFDTFIQQQIAGDELLPGDYNALIGTGYLATGPKDIVENNARTRANEIDDIVSTTSVAILGLTVGCARCHNHKYDPVPQADYYRLAAIFAPSERRDIDLCTPEERKAVEARISQSEQSLSAIRAVYNGLRSKGEAAARKMGSLQPAEAEIEFGLGSEVQPYRDARQQIDIIEIAREQVPTAMAVTDAGPTFAEYHIHKRGDAMQLGDAVKPGFLSCLPNNTDIPSAPLAAKTTGRRTELARWLTRADNPLPPRVWVNRVWRHHFGRGIVGTPSDFGINGDRPSHPELLDYLADRFIQLGWKTKPIHREILMSRTWMQSSQVRPEGLKVDPLNLALWRVPMRRVEGEVVRDTMLQVAGTLNLKMGGLPVYPPIDPTLRSDTFQGMNWPIVPDDAASWRRSVYVKVKRSLIFPQLEVFDCPEITASVAARNSTTTPLQALTLLNDPLVVTQSLRMAADLESRFGPTKGATLATTQAVAASIYNRVFQRNPTRKEVGVAVDVIRTQGLARFCQLIFNLNEFVYIP